MRVVRGRVVRIPQAGIALEAQTLDDQVAHCFGMFDALKASRVFVAHSFVLAASATTAGAADFDVGQTE